MKYCYEEFDSTGKRLNTFLRFNPNYKLIGNHYVVVENQITKKVAAILKNEDDWDGWWERIQREEVWITRPFSEIIPDPKPFVKPSEKTKSLSALLEEAIERGKEKPMLDRKQLTIIKKDPMSIPKKDQINPTHYKDIVPGMQYMEMMQHMLSKFDGVEAHLMGQIYKYLMRCGGKDATLQELEKVKWYTDFLVAYHKNGCQPIKVEDIQRLLSKEAIL